MADLSKLVDELSSLTALEAAELVKLLEVKSQTSKVRQPMVSLVDIKKDLPAWPDDVIDQWLHYFANEPDLGWPPPDPLGNHRWGRILGSRPLSWWSDVTSMNCGLPRLSQKSKSIVTDMIAEISTGKADAKTKRRFDDAFHYVLNNAALPKPLLTMRGAAGTGLRFAVAAGCPGIHRGRLRAKFGAQSPV